MSKSSHVDDDREVEPIPHPSVSVDKSLRTRRHKCIPPRHGYSRDQHISESSLYMRVPLDFYASHLRTCVRLLVEMHLDRSMLLDQEFYVCLEMRVLVTWIASENAMSWSSSRVSSYVRDLCASISLDARTGRCPKLSHSFVQDLYARRLRIRQTFE